MYLSLCRVLRNDAGPTCARCSRCFHTPGQWGLHVPSQLPLDPVSVSIYFFHNQRWRLTSWGQRKVIEILPGDAAVTSVAEPHIFPLIKFAVFTVWWTTSREMGCVSCTLPKHNACLAPFFNAFATLLRFNSCLVVVCAAAKLTFSWVCELHRVN